MYNQQNSCCYGMNGNASVNYTAGNNFGYHACAYRNSSIDLLDDCAPKRIELQCMNDLVLSDKKMPENYAGLYLSNARHNYFVIEPFLTNAVKTIFVDDAELIEEPCRQAFRATTGKELPNNIIIHLCSGSELKQRHLENGGKWSAGIQGFSINKGAKNASGIFVKKDTIDRVMVTLGHEIGHVISPALPDARDEEAKAFAFSIAWMNAIIDNNIAGLTNAIAPLPASNGIHDAGFEFVQCQIHEKKTSAFDVFIKLTDGLISINSKLERITLN